jgi:hypothetical protein
VFENDLRCQNMVLDVRGSFVDAPDVGESVLD